MAGERLRVERAAWHAAAGTTAAEPVATRPAVRGQATVLLVEDEDSLRNLLGEVLAMDGHRVLTAGDAEQAMQILASHDGRIELVLTDLVMPGMGGAELGRRIAARHPETSILYMSGRSGAGGEAEQDPPQGSEILLKPFTLAALADRVRRILASRSGS